MRASPLTQHELAARAVSSYSADLQDLIAWQDREIAAGRAYRPENTSSAEMTTASGFTFTINNIVCGLTVGNKANYENNKMYLCNTVRDIGSLTLRGLRFITQEELYEDNEVCTAITHFTLAAGGWFVDNIIGDNCGEVFDELYGQCHDKGGSAHIMVKHGSKKTTGTIQNDFFPRDPGEKCPANPVPHHYCKVRLAN